MFVNDYQGKIQTPWILTPVPLSATYAQTIDRVNNSPIATFLVELRIDDQVYYRDAPHQVQLTWKPTMDR